jgi:hypothetical protein
VGYDVLYDFSGFKPPVDNPPTINVAQAGTSIPVRFSLDGYQGLDVLAAAPTSAPIPCDPTDPQDRIERVTKRPSGLTYRPKTDSYVYVWQTSRTWIGQCRQFTLQLRDGSTHTANFEFRR